MYKPSKILSQFLLIMLETGMQFSTKSTYTVKWLRTQVVFPPSHFSNQIQEKKNPLTLGAYSGKYNIFQRYIKHHLKNMIILLIWIFLLVPNNLICLTRIHLNYKVQRNHDTQIKLEMKQIKPIVSLRCFSLNNDTHF